MCLGPPSTRIPHRLRLVQSVKLWRAALSKYPATLALVQESKPRARVRQRHFRTKTFSFPFPQDKLVALDKWREDLTETVTKRGHVTHDELVKLMGWKMMVRKVKVLCPRFIVIFKRGKFRPLAKRIASNAPDVVEKVTEDALKCVADGAKCMQTLTALNGVGPASASALMNVFDSSRYAFMADERYRCLGSLFVGWVVCLCLTQSPSLYTAVSCRCPA